MKWLKDLWVGEKIGENRADVIRFIEHPVYKSRYAFMLNQKHFNREDRVILGIAAGMDEAIPCCVK